MTDIPQTRYAKAPDGTSIAYQVAGDGPVDLVYATGIWSNVEIMWEHPLWAHFLKRLARFSRLILFDMRGFGLSDRGPEPPVIELQRDDVAAVMDAAGSEGAIVFGGARASSMAMLFAATHPERTKALILYAPVAKSVSSPDFPHGKSAEEQAAFFERFLAEMGTSKNLDLQAPSVAERRALRRVVGTVRAARREPERVPGARADLHPGRRPGCPPVDPRPDLGAPPGGRPDRAGATGALRRRPDRERHARRASRRGSPALRRRCRRDPRRGGAVRHRTDADPAHRLGAGDGALHRHRRHPPKRQAELGDVGWKDLVERHHAIVRDLLATHRGERAGYGG